MTTSSSYTLLIIDPQVDFHEGGSLAVPGAVEDSNRIADLIRTHGDQVDKIIVSLDTHNPCHIAFPAFWVNSAGEQPPPFTAITHSDVLNGQWLPANPEYLDYALKYTSALEGEGRFTLIVWPYHCIRGTDGHNVVPGIQSAIDNWKQTFPTKHYLEVEKGMNNLTEMYSVMKAEVPLEDDSTTQFNRNLMKELQTASKLIIGGQAQSHCVNYTTRDIISQWDPTKLADIIFLRDGSSPVTGFEKESQALFDYLKEMGATVASCDSAIL